MKKIQLLGLAAIIFAAVFIIHSVQASDCSGFGSIPHTSQTVTIRPGSSNYVGISFFNCKDEDLIVEISIDNLPNGWWFTLESGHLQGADRIYLKSQSPTKSPASGGSWFILSDGESYIKTVQANLKIRVPEDIWGGLYTLKATALASPVSSHRGGGFSIIPKFGREFNFYIQVPAPYKPQDLSEVSAEKISEEKLIQDLKDKITENNKIIEENPAPNDNFRGYLDEEPPIIRGTDEERRTGDGLTGMVSGGTENSSIIILAIIILVIAALLFYLRS